MHAIVRRVFLLLILLPLATLSWAEASASVDRTELTLNESFTLTISVDGINIFTQPDLSPLETDFHVLGTSQNSRSTIVNGEMNNSTSWVVQLMPKQTGATSIPPITIGDEQTPGIDINVRRQPSNSNAAGDDDIILEAELSDDVVYVTAQVVLTLRVSMAQSARFRLEEPEIDQAIVQELGEASYQRVRSGRRYDVTEYRYAIFPNIPGELVIDPLNLVAEVLSSRPRSMFDPMMGQSKRVLRRTDTLTINVLDIPDGISPSDWLPAASVTLREEWSKDIQQLKVGESTTRTIELKAQGVMASQLPPLFLPNVDGLKLYSDQPSATDNESSAGIIGKRVERIAVVATRPGRFTLPEQHISWWDTASNSAQLAVLPAVNFEVAGSARPAPGAATQDASPQAAPTSVTTPATVEQAWYLYRQWWWISALLALACLGALTLYLRGQKQLRAAVNTTAESSAAATAPDSEQQAWQSLRSACKTGQAQTIYPALQRWCQQHWQLASLPGIAELHAAGASEALLAQAKSLEQQLYGKGQADDWNASALLEAAAGQRAAKPQRSDAKASPTLPPLYRQD
jgi:hypothetical protein